jgi:sugar (pentulose or hexulose) kinase
MQIFADVFGIPALRCTCNGAASLGAAICAAVATGAYANFVSATEAMTSIEKRFLPNMENHLLYQKINEVYREIQRFTDPLLSLACDKGITI